MLLVPKNGPVFNRVDDASILILIGLQDSLNNSAVKLLLVAPPPPAKANALVILDLSYTYR